MTYRFDVAHGRDVVARWRALAEQRLEYLTELFETGRWRRYHSELAFLENIQEAKAAVQIWRDLSTREASRDNSAVDMSWLRGPRTALPRVDPPGGPSHRLQPPPARIPVEPPPRDVVVATELHHFHLEQPPPAPEPDAPANDPSADPIPDPVMDRLTRDIAAIAERYPLLRNVM